MSRVKVSDFSIINKNLSNAVVTIYQANADGSVSSNKATLYQASTGTAERENPQTLDADGKISNDCYVEVDVVATITGINERTERSLKKIRQNPTEYQLNATNAKFAVTAASSATSAATSEANAATSATNAATSATNAATSESNASTSETNAAASETAAQTAQAAAEAAVAGSLWTGGVRAITNADSPFTITSAHAGTFFNVDTSGGAVTINLPTISSVGEPFTVGVKKTTSDTNSITITSTDNIDGSSSDLTLSNGNEARAISADEDTTPDNWTTASFGATSGNYVIDNFVAGVDFTAGSSTTLTLSTAPGTENNVDIFFDGVYQEGTEYSLSGTTVTLTSAIPLGVTSIEAKIGASVEINIPADDSVTLAKMASGTAGNLITFDASGNPSAVATGTAGQALKSNGAGAAPTFQNVGIQLGTPQASTSGTEIDFTGIPAGTKKITISFAGVSCDGTGEMKLRIGDSGGFETTGYDASAYNGATTTATDAFLLSRSLAAADAMNGSAVLTLINSSTNKWAIAVNVGASTFSGTTCVGVKSLSDTLTQLRVYNNGGHDFDAGEINIMYE